MTVALIDNGSLEPAATRNLRAVATALSAATGVTVHAVSWKHSDRVPAADLDGTPAVTLKTFVRTSVAVGEHDFILVPFFISAQGAIGSALRTDLEKLQRETAPASFSFTFTDGLAARGAIAAIVAARIRETIAVRALATPPVIVVDHGGPSPASAALRDALAGEIRALLGTSVASLTAASMEGADHAHNRPLLADALTALATLSTPRAPSPASAPRERDIVIAPLFLSPGRHAGPGGDLAQIASATTAATGARARFTDLVGTHPLAAATLAAALRDTLSTLHDPVPIFA